MINSLMVLISLAISIPTFAMEITKARRPSRQSMSTWDTKFIELVESHKGITAEKFINLETCLLKPLWFAKESRMNQTRLAKLIYDTIPLVRHRLGCKGCLGNTFMHPIAASGNAKLLDELLNIHEQQGRKDIDLVNIRGLDGATPMHFAIGNGVRNDGIPAENGDLGVVITLREHLADLSLKDNTYNLTPFGHALLSKREAGRAIANYLMLKPEIKEVIQKETSVFEYLKSDMDNHFPYPGMYPTLEKYCKGYANLYKRLTGKEFTGVIPETNDDEQ